jgi:hypothetical protein
MTNFEKWKSGLVPEKLLYSGLNSGNLYRAAIIFCSHCPADSCPRKDPKCIGRDAICEREFLKWAGSEVKENNALRSKIDRMK